ncbi:hypothetical protein [Salibacterium aidingense]|uniref:hypothetical protein n=1 Tax=Salibacterium aidingense TaxID=384933 RepID=UPI00047B3D37|nr:hypothetical protein [Salibacterium aidingense]
MSIKDFKPLHYPDSMTARIVAIVTIGFLIQLIVDSTLPTLRDYYFSQYGKPYPNTVMIHPHAIIGYVVFILPVACYTFMLPKNKLFQTILFTTIVLPPLVWYDYHSLNAMNNFSETLNIFRHAFISVPAICALHIFLPQPQPQKVKHKETAPCIRETAGQEKE